MRVLTTSILIFVLLSASVLAGCIDDAEVSPGDEADECVEDCPSDDLTSEDGRDLRTDLLANDSVPAPQWEVGDLFAQHIFDGPDDTSGFHIDSVVVEDTGGEWVIAPNSEELALRHAFWEYPFLGAFDKDNLASSAYGYEWDFFFEFPLEHGKTWDRNVVMPHPSFFWWMSYDVTFEVEYAESVDTYDGDFPGFFITGTTSEDELLFSYYYVPMLGWYDHFYWYDLTAEDSDTWRMHAMSMGTGKNWTGSTFIAEVEQRLEFENFFCPFVTEDDCQPENVHASFTLSEDTRLFGVVVTAAWGGTSHTVLHPPEGGTRTYEHTNTDLPDPESEGPDDVDAVASLEWFDEPSIPGDWQFANSGAGVFWGAFVFLLELSLQEQTIE